jgi:hypothetical protein
MSLGASVPRGRFRPGEIYLGWQYCGSETERGRKSGPRLGPLSQPELARVSEDWLAAQHREQRLLDLPAWLGLGAAGIEATGAAAARLAGALGGVPVLFVLAVSGGSAAWCLAALARGRRALRTQIRAEHDRVGEIRRAQQADQAAPSTRLSHGDARHRSLTQSRRAHWYPVTVPAGIDRIDVAGGTPAGWSALVTMVTAARLASGGQVTVVDLTDGGATDDLAGLAAEWGLAPSVQVLPSDLPLLELGPRLTPEALADVLALTAAAMDPGGTADPVGDAALIGQVLSCLRRRASVARVLAAFRVLGQVGAARDQLGSPALTGEEVTRLLGQFGRGAEQLVIDRAWALESRLRPLGPLGAQPGAGTDIAAPYGRLTDPAAGRLKVVRFDRAVAVTARRTLSSFLVVAVTQALRQAPAGEPWGHTVCLLGADGLPGDVLDRLCAASEAARGGLVIAYRAIPAPVRERLGRGNAAVAFMRLGNAEDARAAAEQIGTEHRFVISQLTDTIGASVTGTAGHAYTRTAGVAESVADSGSRTWTTGRGRGRAGSGTATAAGGSVSREVSSSAGTTDSWSITQGISAGTSWGWNTARAMGTSSSLAGTLLRSREFIAEQHELQHLPQTAVLVCQPGAAGREVTLADANPAIMTLPGTTLARRPPGRA